jgi:selenocysteine lyase/cysteine desulfurase
LVNYQTAYRPKADRYNVGERSNFILNPMLAESLRQINEWGVDNIQHYCQSLLTDALVELRNAGYWVEDQQYRASHLFGLRVPTGADISKIQAELKKRNVLVSFRGDAIRVSPHLYNTSNDVAMLLEGLLA